MLYVRDRKPPRRWHPARDARRQERRSRWLHHAVSGHNFLNNLRTLKEPGYRIEDFTVVGLLGQTSYVLIIPSALPAKICRSSSRMPVRGTAR